MYLWNICMAWWLLKKDSFHFSLHFIWYYAWWHALLLDPFQLAPFVAILWVSWFAGKKYTIEPMVLPNALPSFPLNTLTCSSGFRSYWVHHWHLPLAWCHMTGYKVCCSLTGHMLGTAVSISAFILESLMLLARHQKASQRITGFSLVKEKWTHHLLDLPSALAVFFSGQFLHFTDEKYHIFLLYFSYLHSPAHRGEAELSHFYYITCCFSAVSCFKL